MAPSKLRKAIGAVKDQTSISLAKVAGGGSDSLSDLEVAVVKATRHEEYPPEERHVREILNLTRYSRVHVAACVSSLSKRLSKTRNWVVALKALMLVHRLLNDGDTAYEQEIFFATRRGTRFLNMCDFRDASRSDSWDYSAFVRTYALYLDEQLEFRMQNRRRKRRGFTYEEEDEPEEEASAGALTPAKELKNEIVYSRVHHYAHILQRFLACKPTGSAKSNRLVMVALYPVVKESFIVYHEMAELLEILIDRFMDLSIPESVKVHEIFCRVAKEFDELDMFYNWSRSTGIARSSEYPEVDNYPQKKLDLMDDLIREKSELEWKRRNGQIQKMDEHEPDPEPEPQPDMNAIKALPPPEDFQEVKEAAKEEKKTQEMGDLLNLEDDSQPTPEDRANQLALALFDGDSAPTTTTTAVSPWKAFNESGDWETALVQSASYLSNQKAQLPRGFDTLLLDGMYKQGTLNHAAMATGSASSVAAFGPPAMLALPAPPSQGLADPLYAVFCIHSGGRAVIDELERNLQLLPIHVEASRMSLHRFGNTSSSSIWYELAYTEAKGRMRKGHRVWQIAFGSGFKCNSAVWQALRNVKPSPRSPWEDCIDRYPVRVVL